MKELYDKLQICKIIQKGGFIEVLNNLFFFKNKIIFTNGNDLFIVKSNPFDFQGGIDFNSFLTVLSKFKDFDKVDIKIAQDSLTFKKNNIKGKLLKGCEVSECIYNEEFLDKVLQNRTRKVSLTFLCGIEKCINFAEENHLFSGESGVVYDKNSLLSINPKVCVKYDVKFLGMGKTFLPLNWCKTLLKLKDPMISSNKDYVMVENEDLLLLSNNNFNSFSGVDFDDLISNFDKDVTDPIEFEKDLVDFLNFNSKILNVKFDKSDRIFFSFEENGMNVTNSLDCSISEEFKAVYDLGIFNKVVKVSDKVKFTKFNDNMVLQGSGENLKIILVGKEDV